MATPRTPCHLTMQARSLRVPDSCDDHTTPSGLVVNSLAESRYWSMHTLALPDPSLTQWGLVTFLACALHQLFVRSCDLAHHPLYCSHVCASTHRNSLQHLPHLCLSWLSFSSQLEEQQNMRLPHGTTGRNHSYYTGIPHSAPHSLQQLQAGASSPPSRADIGLHTGAFLVQRLQALCPAHRLHTVPSVHRFRRAPLASSQVT